LGLAGIAMSSRFVLMRSCNSSRPDLSRPQASVWLPVVTIWLALIGQASISPALAATAHAAPCPRPGTLGTSRVLEVDVATTPRGLEVDVAPTPRVGLQSFPETLPLADHEVVLTFDDGPWPPTTSKVLAALAHECVHATFFLIGKPASEHPELVPRIAAEGHTVGTHTWTHFSLMRMPPDDAVDQIDHGITAVQAALQGAPLAPFFPFPGFERTHATLDLLQSRGIMVFGADL